MAYNKRTWLGRQGTGLNKFSIGGATPVTIVNQPDSVTQVGDALSAGNMNDLEDRIESGFDDVDTALATKADQTEVTNLNDAIAQHEARIENLEEAHGSYHEVDVKSVYTIPSGKGSNWLIDGLRGVSRATNNLVNPADSSTSTVNGITFTNNGDGSWTISGATGGSPAQKQIVPYNMKANHSYLLAGARNNVILAYIGQGTDRVDEGSGIVATITTDTYKALFIYVRANVTLSSPVTIRPISTDLNVYFNTSDLSFLGATDSAKLATIQTNYPELLVPSDYDAGSIVDTEYSAVESKWKNLWNGTANVGKNAGGADNPSRAYTVINTEIGKTYTVLVEDDTVECDIFTSNSAFIARIKTDKPYTFTSDSTSYQILWVVSSVMTIEDVLSTRMMFCEGVRTTTGDTLTFPSPVSLKSAGAVAEEYYPESGRVTHPIGSYTFTGNETYSQLGDNPLWSFGLIAKGVSSNDQKGNIICSALVVSSVSAIIADSTLDAISVAQSGTVFISTVAYNNRANLVGKTINYELATPSPDTYVDPILDNLIATEPGGTIESILTTPVDDSMTLGYINL